MRKGFRARVCSASVFISLFIFFVLGFYLEQSGVAHPYGWASISFSLIILLPFILGLEKIRISFPLVIVAAYLILGFTINGWHPWWVLFLLIPLISSIFDAIAKKKPGEFCFPVLITIIYVLVSHYFDLYHPFWIIYLTVPAFYTITSAFDKKEEKPEK